jgi:hypothetical protein
MNRRLRVTSPIQVIHVAAFSLNVGLLIMALVLLYPAHSVISRLNQFEIGTNRLLGLRQTDLILGYWEFLVPGVALAACIWLLLRMTSRTSFARVFLQPVAGFTALAAAPLYWLCATNQADARYGWSPLRAIQLYELVLILILASLVVFKWRELARWPSIVVLLAHYGFWFWQFRAQLSTALGGYGDAPAFTSFASFAAGLAWFTYAYSTPTISLGENSQD